MKPKSEFIIRWINYTFGDVSWLMPTVYVMALFILALLIVWSGTVLWCRWRFYKRIRITIKAAHQELETEIVGLKKDLELANKKVSALRKDLLIWERAGARLQELAFESNKIIQSPTRLIPKGGE